MGSGHVGIAPTPVDRQIQLKTLPSHIPLRSVITILVTVYLPKKRLNSNHVVG